MRIVCSPWQLAAGLLVVALPWAQAAAQEEAVVALKWPTLVAVLIPIAVIAVAFGALLVLQRRFLGLCRELGDLEAFSKVPLGVPAGSVRSVLAMSIIFGSLGYLALSLVPKSGIEFPQVMGGILGTVIGFYFGNRSGGGDKSAEALEQIGAANRARDRAVGANDRNRLGQALDKAKDGVAVAKLLTGVLPESLRKTAERTIEAVDKGVGLADKLSGQGNHGDAASKAELALAAVQKGNPLLAALDSAGGSFGKVLGGTVPAIGLATVVIGVGAKLAGASYDRWRARVLNAPYTPELFPPEVIDASMARSILARGKVLRRVFAPEIRQGNLKVIGAMVPVFLAEGGEDTLWARDDIASRFVDRTEYDEAVDEFHRLAMGEEVARDVDPTLLEPAGGLDKVLTDLDRVNADSDAQASLDQLMLMVSALKRDGRDVDAEFKQALETLQAGEAAK